MALRGLIAIHQSIYPVVPPQGIYFESLVEEAFRRIKKPFTIIEPGGRNQPRHDLLVDNVRVSLKTETGEGTKSDKISITKLCTTEREPWGPNVLKERVMQHLARYDVILMLRAVWKLPVVQYQLVEIPVELLRLIGEAVVEPVGKRVGRRSLGGIVYHGGNKLFRVHFDGSDGKCPVRDLAVADCTLLESWERTVDVPTRTYRTS